MKNLTKVFREMGYDIEEFPHEIKNQEQNIFVKFSPDDLDLELITKFEIGKSFEDAFSESETMIIKK